MTRRALQQLTSRPLAFNPAAPSVIAELGALRSGRAQVGNELEIEITFLNKITDSSCRLKLLARITHHRKRFGFWERRRPQIVGFF
jgi:hypothetical protein